MPTSRTMADLRLHADEIARLCQEESEPVFITDNGKHDLVIMSFDAYEEAQGRLDLYQRLDEAEHAFQNGDRGISVEAMRERLPG